MIELVIAILIMGIMAGIAAPRYLYATGKARIDSAARRLGADLRYARSEAMRSTQDRTVEFFPSGNRYRLNDVPDPDRTSRDYSVTLTDDPYGVELVSVDFAGAEEIRFNAYGFADAAGEIRLRYGQHRVSVKCDRLGASAFGGW